MIHRLRHARDGLMHSMYKTLISEFHCHVTTCLSSATPFATNKKVLIQARAGTTGLMCRYKCFLYYHLNLNYCKC